MVVGTSVIVAIGPAVVVVAVGVVTVGVSVVSERRKFKNCQYTPTGSPAVNPTQRMPNVNMIAKYLLDIMQISLRFVILTDQSSKVE